MKSIAKTKLQVRFNPDFSGDARENICSILNGGTDELIPASRALAGSLHQVQPRNASSGVLLIVKTINVSRSGVAIMKMEPQEGARLEWNGDHCDIRRMVDLMLTEHTRLYKVGYFEAPSSEGEELFGLVADYQANSRRVSDYFMEKFLCCSFAQSPKEITRSFHSLTHQYINEVVQDPQHRAQYGLALISELNSNSGTFSPQLFAAQHLEGDDRQTYEEFMSRKGMDATAVYPKDTDLIKARLKVTTLEFAGGMSVVGSPDAFSAHVTTEELPEGQLEVTIKDTLKTVKS